MEMKQSQQLGATRDNDEDHMDGQREKSPSHSSTNVIETEFENGMWLHDILNLIFLKLTQVSA
jgi:hypothetical protein